MKLGPDAVSHRQRVQAIVFAGWALVILAAASDSGETLPPLAFALPLFGMAYIWPAARAAGQMCRRLASRPLLSAALIGTLALASSAAISLSVAMPEPAIHDEFSYLLAADTFAHGRLTNPTHPMWMHFEAPHIFHVPTYMSKFHPAQGAVLAAGQVLFGHPIAGVWLSAGLACGALTWMLAGWMPGWWALAGGLLTLVHPLTIWWGHSYWGGLVAAFGGALVLGAFPRILREPCTLYSMTLGVGLAILAFSRPYEGLLLSFPFVTALGVWLVRRGAPLARIALCRVVLPLAGVLAVVVGGMLYYNHRITGDALTLPYVVHDRAYMSVSPFIVMRVRPVPIYRHEHLRQFFTEGVYEPVRTLGGLAAWIRSWAGALASFYLRSLLIVPAIAVALPLERNAWRYLAILSLGLFVVGLGMETYVMTHYTAPAAGLILLVALQAMRCVAGWRVRGIRLGQPLVRALWLLLIGILALGAWHIVRSLHETGWNYDRARMAARLADDGSRHLVIVRYGPNHNLAEEWVYNAANIDAAPVVWAQEMDPTANARLLSYFKDRRAWLLEPDAAVVRLVPYRVPRLRLGGR
jgi:hypothetical protein